MCSGEAMHEGPAGPICGRGWCLVTSKGVYQLEPSGK